MKKTVKCIMCDDELEEAYEGSMKDYQPYEGGEIRLLFSFGSTKFDNCIGTTMFRACICDNCAEKITDKMKEEHTR